MKSIVTIVKEKPFRPLTDFFFWNWNRTTDCLAVDSVILTRIFIKNLFQNSFIFRFTFDVEFCKEKVNLYMGIDIEFYKLIQNIKSIQWTKFFFFLILYYKYVQTFL